MPAHFGVRSKDYKLIFYYGKHYLPVEEFDKFYWATQYVGIDQQSPVAWEFYDLKKDPQELVNRYDDPAYSEIIQGLKEELRKQREELNETDANYPEIQKVVDENWDL